MTKQARLLTAGFCFCRGCVIAQSDDTKGNYNMGCFDEVCVISRTAIHYGDPVVVLWWQPFQSWNGKVEDIFPHKSTYKALGVLRKEPSWRNQMDDDWDAKDKWAMGGENFVVLRGEYNDYGWIEGNKGPDYSAEGAITPWSLVHEWAAKLALEALGHDLDTVYAEDPILVAKYIVQYALVTRIQLFYPDHLLGGQHFDDNEINMQIALLDKTREFLVKRLEDY